MKTHPRQLLFISLISMFVLYAASAPQCFAAEKSFRMRVPPGSGISVSRVVDTARITMIIPGGTRIAEVAFSSPEVKPFLTSQPSPRLEPVAAVQISAFDSAGEPVKDSPSPLFVAITFSPRPDVVRAAYAKIQLYVLLDGSHHVPAGYHQSTNEDGTITVSGHISNFGIVTVVFVGTGLTDLTNSSEDDTAPSWGALGIIVFDSLRNNNWDIYSMGEGGSGLTRLTSGPTVDVHPALSPDAMQIAYLASASMDGPGDIFVMNQNGSRQTNLTNRPAHYGATTLEWSPNGFQILFDSYDATANTSQLYVINANGRGLIRLTNNLNRTATSGKWSPDGSRVVFNSTNPATGETEIHSINANASGETNLSRGQGTDFFPAWSPDGRLIAFSSLRNGWCNLYTMNVDGTGVRQLTALSGGGGLINPAWSPNGTLILAVGNVNPGDNNIYVLNRDGGGLANVSLGNGEAPVWSPDGGRIAFASNRDGNWEIYAVNAQ